MSSTKIYPFNTLQLRLVNQLIVHGNAGRKTDVLAVQVGISPSEVAFELLKLRELGYVSTVNDGSSYVTWYSSPGLVDALKRHTASKVQCSESVNATPKLEVYKVFGPANSRYMPMTYTTESHAIKEATLRAKQEPGQDIQIYVLHKTVKWEPPVVPEGKLIIN